MGDNYALHIKKNFPTKPKQTQDRRRERMLELAVKLHGPRLSFLFPVKFVLSPTEKKIAKQFAFKEGQHFLFLGEIPGMSGHCAVVDRKGKVHWGYHTENFRKLTKEEI